MFESAPPTSAKLQMIGIYQIVYGERTHSALGGKTPGRYSVSAPFRLDRVV
jgi:hypothetical protein